jgi:hypothetical protein
MHKFTVHSRPHLTVHSRSFRKSPDLAADLKSLRECWGVEIVAAVLDEQAVPLATLRWPHRSAVMLGNEYDGLADPWLDFCARKATIPMARATDSLNLGVAAGIFIYEMMSNGDIHRAGRLGRNKDVGRDQPGCVRTVTRNAPGTGSSETTYR